MADRTIKNISASVHQRLLNLARETNRPFNELLQHFAIQRFLFRFSHSPHTQKFVLKGAQMLQAWESPSARPTMDIDMLGQSFKTTGDLENIVRDCALIEVGPDGVQFEPDTVRSEVIIKSKGYQGTRIHVYGTLGKIRLSVQTDFAFGDIIIPEPVWIELPDLLGLGAPRLLGYTPESAIAEKFQAMVALDLTNTRIKDFYDIWTLSRTREFEGATLAKAIETTFSKRSTTLPETLPTALTEEFSEDAQKQSLWVAFLRKGRLAADDKQLPEVVTALGEFLMPPTIAARRGEKFNQTWQRGQWS
jgi:predicted nucleotidyltransferase component of viral defense system